MKKNIRRILSVMLCVLMTISAVGSFTLGVSAQSGTAIYVSDSGDDANDGTSIDKPVKTLSAAAKLAGEGGTVIVTDSVSVSPGEQVPGTTFKGLNANSVINLTGWCMRLAGPATIENVTLNAKVAWSYVLAQGHKLVIGDGVTVTADEGINTALSIRGGGDNMEIGGSCEVVIKSGAWKNLIGGTRNKDTKGNVHVTIYDTAIVSSVSFGNENSADASSVVHGSSTIKLVGKTNPIPGSIQGNNVQANRYIDITEYEGMIPNSWYNLGATILTDKTKIPEDAKPVSEGGVVGVFGKTYDTGAQAGPAISDVKIYLSDNGNDSNDGKSVGSAVKSLAVANKLAGTNGTIIIADSFTCPGGTISAARLEGFTPTAELKMTGWVMSLGTNCEIDNLTINATVNWSFILCNGYKLTVGENVTINKSDKATVSLSIRGGGEKSSVSGNINIILKSGTWNAVYAGTKAGNVGGNASVTVYPGATVSTFAYGNDSPTATDIIGGRSVLKLMGDKTSIGKLSASTLPKGGCFLDISEYSGQIPEAWDLSQISTITESGVEAPVETAPSIVTPPTAGEVTDVVPGNGVIYISDNGSNENDGKTPERPVKTIDNALTKGGANPTVVVVDTFSSPASMPGACRIVGYSSESTYTLPAWAVRLGGNTTFENITIVSMVKFSYILAMGNSLTIGENVTVKKGDGVTTNLGIRGGGDGQALTKNSNIVLMSGSWGDVHGGTRNASINGNTFITVHEGATTTSLNIGNNGVSDGNTFNGSGVIKLVGAPTIGKISAKPEYQTGDMILDLSEFTGAFDDAWTDTGATVVTDAEKLPDFVKEQYMSAGGTVKYDLSAITSFRYVSENGSDTNDGLTEKTPMKSFAAAVKAMGEGGTVIVTGQYTLAESTAGLPAFNITSSASTDKLIMGIWAIRTNNTHIYNIEIEIPKDYYYILHGGTPLHIGKNVTTTLTNGAKVYLGIRGEEKGDVEMVDITIDSGDWASIYTGTKNGNIIGSSTVTMTGGTTTSITVGNDSAEGRILGSTKIVLKDKPFVTAINNKEVSDGYVIVDISEFTGVAPFIPADFTVVTDKNSNIVPMNKSALFINGYPDGTFLPENVMTRAEAVTVASKVAGFTSYYAVPETTAFTDLKADDWFAPNVKYLESFGALTFWGSTLDASKGITRGEFVKLISGMIEKTEGEAPTFTDVTAAHPFYNDIIAAAKAGLVTGYPDGTFLPDNTLKRSEIVTILCRLTRRNIVQSNTAKITKFSDIVGHWAAPQIIAASCTATTDGIIVWYSGEAMSANSPIDRSTIELPVTSAILSGVDVNNTGAVTAAIDAYAEKRRAEIANTPTSVSVSGTSYYVSSLGGNDANDGKTPETAWQTLGKVNTAKLSEGDGVFFKRGEIFRGQLTTQSGVTYSAYGEGAKPAIYGSERNYSNSGFWLPTSRENIYVSSETFMLDVGLIVFDEGKEVGLKEAIGLKSFLGALTKDLQFFHDQNDNKLYLYSVSDPNTRWTSTEIAQGRHGISGNGNGVTIDNLCIKYAGAHGIGYSNTTGLTVQNCEIGWIGGMLQNTTRIVRYGNGVEIYVGCKDYTITNCHIYQVYDAGITHQYFQTQEARVDMENINYTDNVIEYCTYDIEYVNAQQADKGVMKNVDISGNLLLHGGEGWGQQRGDSTPAVIKGWSDINHAVNAVYTDNVIMTMAEKCALLHLGVGEYSYMPELYGNLLVGKRGANFGFYGLKSNSTWYTCDENITDITIGLDDNTIVFID